MDVLRDQDAVTRKATLSRILKIFRKRSGLKSVEVAKLMNKGLRTYQRWESGYYGVQIDPIYRFAEIVQVDRWGIIFGRSLAPWNSRSTPPEIAPPPSC